MASPSPDIPAQTEIDTRIDALLHDVNAAEAAMSDALSPAGATPPVGGSGLGSDFDTALDDALVSTLLNQASAEIEASTPGALDLPPEVELPGDAPVDPSLVAVEQSLIGGAAATAPAPPEALAPIAETTSPELEGVLGDLNAAPAPVVAEAPSPEAASDDLLGAVSELLDQAQSEPAVASQAVDVAVPDVAASSASVPAPASPPAPAPAPAHAPAPEAADAESLAAAMLDVSAALEPASPAATPVSAPAPIAPRAASESTAPAGAAQDFEFVAPEALTHEKSPSVRELDEQLASAAPKAVEAAISAAAAKATKPEAAEPEHHAAAHAANEPSPQRVAPPLHGVHTDAPAPAATTAPSPHASPSSSSPASSPLAAADAQVLQPAGPGVFSLAVQGAAGIVGAALSPLVRVHSKLGESMRQTVGYVAVMTLFFAVAIWAFYLLKESPKLDAVSPQKTLLMPGEQAPESAHSDGHGSEGAAHASADAHAPAGAASHAPSKPAKKEDGHGGGAGSGGGAHGESKSAKKEPPKKTSSTKKDAAKKGADKKGAQQASGH